MRGYFLVGCTSLAIVGCGGGGKKKVKKPKVEEEVVEPEEKPETEEDREQKRRAQAKKIVPEGSTCLPVALKEEDAPRLELAASGADAIVCALDVNQDRLLGPVGCWKVDLATGGLTYKEPEPLPGRGFSVRLDERCARGYCLPESAKVAGNKVAHIAWDTEGKKVAVLVGDDVHLFDAASKDHESTFSVRGDNGLTNNPKAVHVVGETVVVEGADDGPFSAAWVFKADGTPGGPVLALGGKEQKPVSTYKGSLSILDKARIGLAERGMETLTTYELDTGKRAKLVRKLPKLACKPAEIDAYWADGDKVTDKCKDSIDKASGHLIGATAVAGAKNFLVLLRGNRLGELGVLDAKSLAEKKAIKMPWCSDEGGGGEAAAADDEKTEKTDQKKTTRGASSDPEEGGE